MLISLIEYKTLVMREDYEGANSILPTIPQVGQQRRCLAQLDSLHSVFVDDGPVTGLATKCLACHP